MNEAMTTYFDGEKNAGLMVAGIGAAVMIAALILFPSKWELRAFSITLMVFALLGTSSLPVLRAIGVTVTIGVVSNFILALLLTRPAGEAHARP